VKPASMRSSASWPCFWWWRRLTILIQFPTTNRAGSRVRGCLGELHSKNLSSTPQTPLHLQLHSTNFCLAIVQLHSTSQIGPAYYSWAFAAILAL
jgi:hypothetical protein